MCSHSKKSFQMVVPNFPRQWNTSIFPYFSPSYVLTVLAKDYLPDVLVDKFSISFVFPQLKSIRPLLLLPIKTRFVEHPFSTIIRRIERVTVKKKVQPFPMSCSSFRLRRTEEQTHLRRIAIGNKLFAQLYCLIRSFWKGNRSLCQRLCKEWPRCGSIDKNREVADLLLSVSEVVLIQLHTVTWR